jgi:hypothetical protein
MSATDPKTPLEEKADWDLVIRMCLKLVLWFAIIVLIFGALGVLGSMFAFV